MMMQRWLFVIPKIGSLKAIHNYTLLLTEVNYVVCDPEDREFESNSQPLCPSISITDVVCDPEDREFESNSQLGVYVATAFRRCL